MSAAQTRWSEAQRWSNHLCAQSPVRQSLNFIQKMMYCCLFSSDPGLTWIWPGSPRREASEAICGVSGETAICCRQLSCKYRAKTIRDLFCSVYGNFLRQSDTNPSHTPQIPPTMPAHKTTLTLYYFLSIICTHPHWSTHTHTQMSMHIHTVKAEHSMQVELNRNSSGWKWATVQSVETQGEIQLNFALQRKWHTHSIIVSVQISIMLSPAMNHNENSLTTASIFLKYWV